MQTTAQQPNTSTTPQPATPDTTIDWSEPPTRYLNVGHSELAHWRVGSGPDVVFVHGWPVSSSTWRGLIPRLAERFTCHLIDLPGAGLTRCHDPSVIELGAHVDTMERAVELLGLERYALVAHDSGAVVARHLAARQPGRVAGLVMGNTEIPGHFPWQLVLYLATAKVPGGGTLFTRLLRSRRFRGSGLAFGTCFTDPGLAEGEFYELTVRPMLDDEERRRGTLKLLDTFDTSALKTLKKVHGRIQAPTLLVWGAQDPFFPLDKARGMVEQFADAQLKVLDPGKLFVHEERPGDFAEAARPFLDRCLSADD